MISFLNYIALSFVTGVMMLMVSCSEGEKKSESTGSSEEITADPMKDKGIGPVSNIILGEIDNSMTMEGKKIYDQKCVACHNPTVKLIGPPQKGVLDRRTPEWVMNMILNPKEMLDKNPIAKQLLKEYNNIPMTYQGLTQEEARKVLEYIRAL